MVGDVSSTPDNPTAPVLGSQNSPLIRRIAGWRRLLTLPLAWLLKLWGRSLRFETDPESLAILRYVDNPIAFTLWHNRLFLASEILRRYRNGRPAYALVSASRDGAWLEAFFSMVGMRCVRGSSSKLGREAASALIEVLKGGQDIGVTPDGPRGPCYEVKAGALIVARRAHVHTLVIGGEFRSAWRLKSWDRFAIPKPFSKVVMRARLISPEEMAGDREQATLKLQQVLKTINPDSDL